MIAELHCHTSNYSACSYVNAVELIKRAYDLGMHAIVITDHHYKWNDEDLEEVKKKADVPNIFHVLTGQEFKTSDYGDILVYGAAETIKKQAIPLEEVRDKYPEVALIWAHPYRHNKIPPKEKLLNPLFDGIEIFSSNYTVTEAARGLKDWHELKFTAIAGTDTHALSYTGSYPTIFDHPFNTIKEMVEELKNGRCRPYFKEIQKAGTTDTKVTEITIAPKKSEERKKLIVKTFDAVDSWKEGERSHHIVNEIYKHGFDQGKFRVSRPLDKDEKNLSLIEEGISGKTLHEKLLKANKEDSERYLRMAAEWLTKLHNLKLKLTPDEEFLPVEKKRLDYYISILYEKKHVHTERVQQVLDIVWENEQKLVKDNPELLMQGHGDFHLKNIFIGKDRNTHEEYIAAIDFNSSYQMPRAFDVGSFVAQYRNMFFHNHEVTIKAPVEIFLEEYLNKIDDLNPNFASQLQLYKARTFLSIIYYLVKVEKGASENFWTILIDTEKSLTQMAYKKSII